MNSLKDIASKAVAEKISSAIGNMIDDYINKHGITALLSFQDIESMIEHISKSDKPETIKISVDGFHEEKFGNEPVSDEQAAMFGMVDLLKSLPPFEMFVHEVVQESDVAAFLAKAAEDKERFQNMLNIYQDWHTDKGLWPSEDCFGKVKS